MTNHSIGTVLVKPRNQYFPNDSAPYNSFDTIQINQYVHYDETHNVCNKYKNTRDTVANTTDSILHFKTLLSLTLL
jgi:hypothetical protein